MIRKEYDIIDIDIKSVVWETKKQKDIIDTLDEMRENADFFGWETTFEDDSFYIEYQDGTTYEANECGEYGVLRKKNIRRIIYTNAADTWVYGNYTVNEYGVIE